MLRLVEMVVQWRGHYRQTVLVEWWMYVSRDVIGVCTMELYS
jgi:hypothetical protein